jgi:hypothetical protein
MGRNYLKGRDGDRINAVLAAAGYNFKRLAAWLRDYLRQLMAAILLHPMTSTTQCRSCSQGTSYFSQKLLLGSVPT